MMGGLEIWRENGNQSISRSVNQFMDYAVVRPLGNEDMKKYLLNSFSVANTIILGFTNSSAEEYIATIDTVELRE